jgi:hypothetical protein
LSFLSTLYPWDRRAGAASLRVRTIGRSHRDIEGAGPFPEAWPVLPASA